MRFTLTFFLFVFSAVTVLYAQADLPCIDTPQSHYTRNECITRRFKLEPSMSVQTLRFTEYDGVIFHPDRARIETRQDKTAYLTLAFSSVLLKNYPAMVITVQTNRGTRYARIPAYTVSQNSDVWPTPGIHKGTFVPGAPYPPKTRLIGGSAPNPNPPSPPLPAPQNLTEKQKLIINALEEVQDLLCNHYADFAIEDIRWALFYEQSLPALFAASNVYEFNSALDRAAKIIGFEHIRFSLPHNSAFAAKLNLYFRTTKGELKTETGSEKTQPIGFTRSDSTAFLTLHGINAQTVNEARKLLLQNPDIRELTLDLSDCDGSSPQAAAQLCGLFCTMQDPLLIFLQRNGKRVLRAPSSSNVYNGALTVRISEKTSSAGEYAAAGLQFHKRAKIIGSPTLGNTDVIESMQTPSGLTVDFMSARAFLPDGAELYRRGVMPDKTEEK